MTPKIQKITREIDKSRTRIIELKERVCDLEAQRTELENTEIVALFRSLELPSDQLPAFIATVKASPSLPEAGPQLVPDSLLETAPSRQDSPTPYTSAFLRDQEDDHEN